MSGKLDRIHKLERQIEIATEELNSISKQVPICRICSGIDLKDVGFDWLCKGCKALTPRITALYIRVPK